MTPRRPCLREIARPDVQRLFIALRSALREFGVRVDERRFAPHLTLMRDARRPARLPDMMPVPWQAEEIALVRSCLDRGGARYDIVARVPLTDRSA